MSLRLDNGTTPALEVCFHSFGGENSKTVRLGEYEISIEDFLLMAAYVLSNTDLEPNDPRLQFVVHVKEMEIIKGYNEGRERLSSRAPVLIPVKKK